MPYKGKVKLPTNQNSFENKRYQKTPQVINLLNAPKIDLFPTPEEVENTPVETSVPLTFSIPTNKTGQTNKAGAPAQPEAEWPDEWFTPSEGRLPPTLADEQIPTEAQIGTGRFDPESFRVNGNGNVPGTREKVRPTDAEAVSVRPHRPPRQGSFQATEPARELEPFTREPVAQLKKLSRPVKQGPSSHKGPVPPLSLHYSERPHSRAPR